MRYLLSFFVTLFLTVGMLTGQTLNIIPEPVKIIRAEGTYSIGSTLNITSDSHAQMPLVLAHIAERTKAGGVDFIPCSHDDAEMHLVLNDAPDAELGREGYMLEVTPEGIHIQANEPAGLFYGVQTLFQLMDPSVESREKIAGTVWDVPLVKIRDYPRVGWRGIMLDVARHFFTVDEVKLLIDNMVKYKFNMLHMHLSDDEGWRVEIKTLPKLTEVGAWRPEKIGNFGHMTKPLPNEPKTYGGFYTHDDIRELVNYATVRFINIMPEIDVPGHSLAAIAAYPELSCTPGAEKYTVRAGEPIMDWSRGAPPIALVDNTLCPANEKVYEFMDKVITELAELFPFEYIHLGGDEAPHNFWEKNPKVLALMKREGLKTMPQVQSYFGKRVEKIVLSKGKKMMGWDEILEGGITPTTALMSWRGMKHGIEASKSGHYVVMSPTEFAYLDYMQADVATEPRVYASLRLNKVYQFDPLPREADRRFILGGQGNLWAEQIYNFRQVEYMLFPRVFAISESLWSPPEKKNWNRFVEKTEAHFDRLDASETKYSPAIYDPSITVSKKNGRFYVTLTPEIEGLDIYTSFDNSTPDRFYPKYTEPQLIPTDALLMRIITYRGKEKMGRLITISVDDLKKRAK